MNKKQRTKELARINRLFKEAGRLEVEAENAINQLAQDCCPYKPGDIVQYPELGTPRRGKVLSVRPTSRGNWLKNSVWRINVRPFSLKKPSELLKRQTCTFIEGYGSAASGTLKKVVEVQVSASGSKPVKRTIRK